MSNRYEDNSTTDTRECEAMRKMFVGGLNRETSDDTFFEYFSQYGNMVDKVVIKDPASKTSRGFGFITYDASESVENVFQSRPHVIDGKTLDVKRAMPRDYNTSTAHAKVTKLFIGGISPDLTPEELQEYIESRHPTNIGTVDKIDFLKDRDSNKNKGFGFLECSDTDFADRLTISENSFTMKGKQMSLKKAEPKQEFGSRGGRGGGGGGGVRGGAVGRGRGRGSGFDNARRSRGGGQGAGGRGGGGYNSNYSGGYGGGEYNNGSGGGYQQNNGYNNSTGYNQSNFYNQQGGGQGGGYQNYSNQNQGGYGQSGGYNQGSAYGGQSGGYGNQGGYGNGAGNQGGGGGRGGGWSGGNRYKPY